MGVVSGVEQLMRKLVSKVFDVPDVVEGGFEKRLMGLSEVLLSHDPFHGVASVAKAHAAVDCR